MYNFFRAYRKLPGHILYFIGAEFFLHLINSSFFLILNIYMSKSGFVDYEIANYTSFRYLAAMLLAFPIGFFLRKKPLKPFMLIASVIVPLCSFGIISSIHLGTYEWLKPLILLWGFGIFLSRVVAIPYILRNCNPDYHSEALALNFGSWSISLLTAGGINFILNTIDKNFFDERFLLYLYSALGLVSIFFILRIQRDDARAPGDEPHDSIQFSDWKRIVKAIMPTLIIAVGAGLTIQFINLFFFLVFGVDSNVYSLMGAGTAALVSAAVLLAPRIKYRYGYKVAITLCQSASVLALILLATTEFFKDWPFMVFIAAMLYMIRQPMMNMANPISSELVMYYVGKKNQEMTSALRSAIWSGSWFFSAQIFRFLRTQEFSFAMIFYITALLYALGVFLFYRLILAYESDKPAME